MEKRKVIFGAYDTALEGAWTVAGLELTSPDFQTNLVQIPGRDGPLDLSTALTGEPVYSSRDLTVVLENSDDDRMARERRIQAIIAQLDGRREQIWLPDYPDYYLMGRIHVEKNYNDLAHAAITVTAICDPWLFRNEETVHTLIATSEAQNATIVNPGRKPAVPVIVVTGGSVDLSYSGYSWTLSAGSYQLPDFVLAAGHTALEYRGAGTIEIKFREAVLL